MSTLLEQHSSREAGGGTSSSRRLLTLAQMDLMAGSEVSIGRQLAAWSALAITVAIAVLLLLGA